MSKYVAEAIRRQPRRRDCLNAEQLVEFYRGQLDEDQTESIRDHLAECSDCLELGRDGRRFLEAMGEPSRSSELRPDTTGSGWLQSNRGKLLLVAASLLVVAGIGVFMWRAWRVESPVAQQPQTLPSAPSPRVLENPWREMQIARAEYVPPKTPREDLIWRDGSARAPNRPTPFAQAMTPYEHNDFSAAEKQLAEFLKTNPNHAAANFYRGVSLLMLGRLNDAVGPLEAGVAHGDSRLREESLWYLAQGHLKSGDLSRALADLDAVISRSGKHRAEAEQLRQKVKQVVEQGTSKS